MAPCHTLILLPALEFFFFKEENREEENGDTTTIRMRLNRGKIKDGTLKNNPKLHHVSSSGSLTKINERDFDPRTPMIALSHLASTVNTKMLHLHLYLFVCVFECVWASSLMYLVLL